MNYLEVLAKLGAGSAHPGGYSATLKLIESCAIPSGSKVLEVGCGTGRTACLLAHQGNRVTAIDIQEEMLEKARLRAQEEKVSVQFDHADIGQLPYPDQSFDYIIAESVTIFSTIPHALSEYYRVLKPGGIVYDREVVATQELPDDMKSEIVEFFKFSSLPNRAEWIDQFFQAGFSVEVSDQLDSLQWDSSGEQPDPHQYTSEGTLLDRSVWETFNKYHRLIDMYQETLRGILFIARK